jgi:hypothetical protein
MKTELTAKQRKVRKWAKWFVALVVVIFFTALIVDISNDPATIATSVVHDDFISARQLKMDLEKSGIELKYGEPVDLDSFFRITSVTSSITSSIFYRADTVLDGSLIYRIRDNRNDIGAVVDEVKGFFKTINPKASEWLVNTLKASGKEIDTTIKINNTSFSIGYYPDVDLDVLNINFETKYYKPLQYKP